MGQERVNGRFVKREAPRAGVRWEYEPPRDQGRFAPEPVVVEAPTPIGHCPECGSRSVQRVGGEWCPRCAGWLVESLIAGHRRVRLWRPQS